MMVHKMKKTVSVVIPSYNSDRTIRYTLDGLLKLNGDYLKEIIVVDSSDNGMMETVKSEYPSGVIRFINAGTRVIPATGRNIGASQANGKIVAFIDSDAYPDQDWLVKIIEAYQDGKLAGGGSVELPPFQQNKKIAIVQFYLQFNEYMPVGEERIKDFIPAVNLYCDKELFLQSGGFPDIRASEDTLFGHAINQITPLWFLPAAKVFHVFREDREAFLNNQKMLGQYIIAYRRIHFKSLIYRGFIPVILFPGFMLVKYSRMVLRITSSRSGEFKRFVKVLPLFMLGLVFWGRGFLKECFAGENYNL